MLIRRFPEEFKATLPLNGDFHAFSHGLFSGNEFFWKPFSCWAAQLLCKSKLSEVIKNLEDNNYEHASAFHMEQTIGITSFLLLDVKDPPPELLLSNPILYLSLINSAGGIVLVRYLLHTGYPMLQVRLP